MAKEEYDVTPDPTLMEDIGLTSFTVPEAIIELVANSIDARVYLNDGNPEEIEGQPLQIEIYVSPEEIRVIDDGLGMTKDVLKEAVRLGVKMDAITSRTTARKGMFGLGMKTACASLGRHWSVITRPRGGDTQFSVEFDLTEWRRNAGNRDFKWVVTIDEADPQGGPLADRPHGTAIVVRNLRDQDPLAGAVLDKVGQAYKPHIESGDSIRVNGEEARSPDYAFIPESYQDIDIVVDEEQGHRVRGWVALDSKTHNDGSYGLNLYRENQLLESWNKSWFRAHLMTSRIIGEAHLDFVPANFYKKGFRTESQEWRLASSHMKAFLKPLARASQDMARNKKDSTRVARALQGLNMAMGKVTDVSPGDVESSTDGPGGNSSTENEAPVGVLVEEHVLVLEDGEKVSLTHLIEDLDSEETPWDYLFDSKSQELQAIVNSSSRLFNTIKDEQFLGMLALADSVAHFLMAERGFTATKAREIRNRWLFLAVEDVRR